MRVFVTGATGFIGSAVVKELRNAGHYVLGLARSDASAAALARAGAEAHRGELSDHASLTAGSRASEAVIHLGFAHDSGDFHAAAAIDYAAIAAIGEALANSGKVFVGTSGTMVLSPGHIGTEEDPADAGSAAAFRVPSERAALAMAETGVRASVVRPSPSVHGLGDKGFVPMLIKLAREKGVSAYVGDGRNRWPAVHQLDAAHLFRLALEKGAAGARYHAVGDEGIAFRHIAEAIGRGLRIPVVSKASQEAADHFGPLTFVVAADNPASNARTGDWLDWKPQHPGLLADLEESHYFENPEHNHSDGRTTDPEALRVTD